MEHQPSYPVEPFLLSRFARAAERGGGLGRRQVEQVEEAEEVGGREGVRRRG
jgi:hypothetical protein